MSSILFYSTRKSKILRKKISKKLHTQKNGPSGAPGPASASPWGAERGNPLEKTERGDPLGFLNTQSVVKHQRNWRGGTLWREKNLEKSLTMPKNWKGDPLGFSNIHSVAKQQKNWRGTLWGKKFPQKSLAVPKKIGRGDPLVSPGMVCYAGKQEKPFWFSSLGQIVHFGAIIFCRTFKNYFGQLVWIERKATIIVAFHFMKPWLKMRILNSLIVPKKVERGTLLLRNGFVFHVTGFGCVKNQVLST